MENFQGPLRAVGLRSLHECDKASHLRSSLSNESTQPPKICLSLLLPHNEHKSKEKPTKEKKTRHKVSAKTVLWERRETE